jgi:hypothetical protein
MSGGNQNMLLAEDITWQKLYSDHFHPFTNRFCTNFWVCQIKLHIRFVVTRGDALGWYTAPQTWRLRLRIPMVSFEFFIYIGPGVDSASNRNEYHDCFLGGKDGRWVGLTTLPPSCADCHEIWEAEPPGTLRACPGLYTDCFSLI